MKRSPLARRTALRPDPEKVREFQARARERSARKLSRPRAAVQDPARAAWKVPRWGRCQNCGLIDTRPLHGHHVFARQVIARAGGDEYDARNRMDLCARCHMESHFGQANRKLSVEKIPALAVVFGVEVLGRDVAADYLRRHYAIPEVEAA